MARLELRRPAQAWTTCPVTGKRGWATKDLARRSRRATPDRDLHVYRCDDCGRWHLGTRAGHDHQWHRDHHAGHEHSGLIEIKAAVRMLRPDRPGKMRAVLERMVREGRVEGETALGVTMIAAHEMPRLKRIAWDTAQDARLKGIGR